ncbi:MAG TPA: UMP kinase [Sphaerochaeta sp.]|jgi:uridylate kinase|nr:MAG: UMP kinase [Spirochaetes bacterium GWC2_52_13]PKL11057.1 MAG: UMP kinase [Spirochaetae bacterium HGW-Spirochaetae-8]PKL20932.1 MAG: UMP kinase [Spirochaetae bacterium HGW-Spirochaetae-4]HCG62644.1 UMP kinase [Sphaerochaeta sp.]HCJ95214.1 UMP kinase [Sphaerochaeta sp.]
MQHITVLSLGGSIIAPEKVDHDFLKRFTSAMETHLADHPTDKVIIVTGGGAPARIYQQAYKSVSAQPEEQLLDWIGIAATHLNGTLVKALFADHCSDPLVTDPTAPIAFEGRILVAAGWKPGFSSDTDAVFLAKRFGAKTVVNLSNIAKVYTADPKQDPDAKPIDTIDWADFRKMVGDTWIPGKNVPFDPIASREAQEGGLQVICADGRNIGNTFAILRNEQFEGTVIG